MQTLSEIPIVLTATIMPNEVKDAVCDPEVRKAEYFRALEYYSNFSRQIYFLENSSYPLEGDSAPKALPNVRVCKFPMSSNPTRGKGYQEFEMLDHWASNVAAAPPKWLKISGRYLVSNIGDLLQECTSETDASLIIDQSARGQTARTHIFFTTNQYYQRVLTGLYARCDDRKGEWIEKVVFRTLKSTTRKEFRFFRTRPDLVARSGTTGEMYPSNPMSNTVKKALRAGNRVFDDRYLWFSR